MPKLQVSADRLNALRAQILLASDLTQQRINDAAIEVSVGLELYWNEIVQRSQKAAWDPCEYLRAFAAEPGLDYSTVQGSEIEGVSLPQMYLVVAWYYAEVAEFFLAPTGFDWTPEESRDHAIRYEFAARQLLQEVLRDSRLVGCA